MVYFENDVDELAKGSFRLVLPEAEEVDPKKVDRIVVCSGKIYYELVEARAAEKIGNVAILRIEQIYPYPEAELKEAVGKYPGAKELLWCQEEPRNQGAWLRIRGFLTRMLSPEQTLLVSMRHSSASPATGIPKKHKEEQAEVVRAALGIGGAQAQSTAVLGGKTEKKSRKSSK